MMISKALQAKCLRDMVKLLAMVGVRSRNTACCLAQADVSGGETAPVSPPQLCPSARLVKTPEPLDLNLNRVTAQAALWCAEE